MSASKWRASSFSNMLFGDSIVPVLSITLFWSSSHPSPLDLQSDHGRCSPCVMRTRRCKRSSSVCTGDFVADRSLAPSLRHPLMKVPAGDGERASLRSRLRSGQTDVPENLKTGCRNSGSETQIASPRCRSVAGRRIRRGNAELDAGLLSAFLCPIPDASGQSRFAVPHSRGYAAASRGCRVAERGGTRRSRRSSEDHSPRESCASALRNGI